MKGRHSPRRHTVHTKHPRYDVTQYNRGSGERTLTPSSYPPEVQPNEINAYNKMLNEAKRDRRRHLRLTPKDMKNYSDMSVKMHKEILTKPVEERALYNFRYWRYRAGLSHDLRARTSWKLATGDVKNKPIKVTKDSYFYKFPANKFFIVRRMGKGWYHFYPRSDFDLPEGYSSKRQAESKMAEHLSDPENLKVVSGVQASRYPVPKRF